MDVIRYADLTFRGWDFYDNHDLVKCSGEEVKMGQLRHSEAEIAAKLQEADALVSEGRLNRDIAKTLGISVMTYHRWRKMRHSSQLADSFQLDRAETDQIRRIRELQLENSRLRRLVTDFLLEKMNLEEVMYGDSPDTKGPLRR